MEAVSQPLVVTLRLDPATQERFEDERRRLFPAGRTQVGAHVTLFHAVPPALLDDVRRTLVEAADRTPYDVEVTGVRSLGRGAAYTLSCPELEHEHARWQSRWRDHLTRQDAQPLRLHVTVQNKVTAEVARATLEDLRRGFRPWRCAAVSFELWRYAGGPWVALDAVPLGPVSGVTPEDG